MRKIPSTHAQVTPLPSKRTPYREEKLQFISWSNLSTFDFVKDISEKNSTVHFQYSTGALACEKFLPLCLISTLLMPTA